MRKNIFSKNDRTADNKHTSNKTLRSCRPYYYRKYAAATTTTTTATTTTTTTTIVAVSFLSDTYFVWTVSYRSEIMDTG